jgi:CRISPR-associated endonuclease Cas2
MSMRWVVAYDVSGNLPRERVAARLLRDGLRLQRSVFQVQSVQPEVLIDEISAHMDLNLDVVQMFRQCRACEGASLGLGQFGPSLQERWWVA